MERLSGLGTLLLAVSALAFPTALAIMLFSSNVAIETAMLWSYWLCLPAVVALFFLLALFGGGWMLLVGIAQLFLAAFFCGWGPYPVIVNVVLYAVCTIFQPWSLSHRSRRPYRRVAFCVILAGLFFSAILFAWALSNRIDGLADLRFLCAALYLFVLMLAGAWLYARLVTASNSSFFKRVYTSDAVRTNMAETIEPTKAGYFLSTFMSPAESTRRIRESISPGEGCFHVTSVYDFKVPETLREKEKVAIPVLHHGRYELTSGLEILCDKNLSLKRMSDEESEKMFARALFDGLKAMEGGDGKGRLREIADRIASVAFEEHPRETDEEFGARHAEVLKGLGLRHGQSRAFVSDFLVAMRYIKPICVSVRRSTGGKLKTNCVTITVKRDVTLVPMRLDPSWSSCEQGFTIGRFSKRLSGCARMLRRIFTKSRMRYYFNLGNADCCQSYHLSFTGPSGAYLTNFKVRRVGERDEFFVASRMKVTNRYDQQRSRVFIRDGKGFSKAALEISYEEKSQVSAVVLCGVALVSLLILLYMGEQFMFTGEKCEIGSSDVVLLLTLLGAGGLVSPIIQAMEKYRSEEWLWLGAGGTAVTSILAVAHVVVFARSGSAQPTLADKNIWIAFCVIEFVIALALVVILFERVKQHGDLMSKIPVVRSTDDGLFENWPKSDFGGWSLSQWERLNSAPLERGTAGNSANRSRAKRFDWRFIRREVYKRDVMVYDCLYNDEWADGWLIPMWSSALNPYRMPSTNFCSYFEELERVGREQ